MNRLREWLDAMGLGVHAELFEREQIDMDAAKHLTEQHLKEMGMPIGHRVKFIAAMSAHSREPIGSSMPGGETQIVSPAYIKEQGERRQLTVLFCDMVGFTELANRVDPGKWGQTLRSPRK